MTPCANCGAPATDPHHILYQQHIRAWAKTHRVDPKPLLDDEANILYLCRACHADHHGIHPLHRDLIPMRAWVFAAELGLQHKLERHYPVRVHEDAA